MIDDLKVAIVQSDLVWESPEQNRIHFNSLLNAIRNPVDVIVLCEMFTTGFSMSPERVAEYHDAEDMATLNWMRGWAKSHDAVITGSVAVQEREFYYNRLYWVLPDGRFNTYDKRHTFSFAGENDHYVSGQSRIIEEWRGWKICPLICYDLRFPVWSRNGLIDTDPAYDVLVYVANWPKVRRDPWNKLLLARAIENQCYVLGANRIGSDANGNQYSGDSAIINPKGDYIFHSSTSENEILQAALSYQELSEFRLTFPVLHDADPFELDQRSRM